MTPEGLRVLEDAELWRMKSEINLVEFLVGCGWIVDEAEKGRDWTTLRKGGKGAKSAEKLIVTRDVDNAGRENYVFLDARNGYGGESIIGYMMQYEGARSIGHARAMIRRIQRWDDPRRQDRGSKTPARQRDVATMAANVMLSAPSNGHDGADASDDERHEWGRVDAFFRTLQGLDDDTYLHQRGLDPEFVCENGHRIRQVTDTELRAIGEKLPNHVRFTNIAFGYSTSVNGCGIVAGLDRRYHDPRTGESEIVFTGKRVGLWSSHATSTAGGFRHIVIAESPVNALSYQQLFRFPRALLLAFGGNMRRGHQLPLVAKICAHFHDAEVRLAIDNDEKGARFANMICAALPPDARVVVVPPVNVSDWNDVLRDDVCCGQ